MATRPITPPEIFKQVTTSDEWQRLVTYYTECLIRENRQQYVLESNWIRKFSSSLDEVRRFMFGEIQLVFKKGSQLLQDPVARFIDSNRDKPDIKLCLGYPFLVVDQDKIAPLIYVPVEIISNYDNFTLRSEGFEVSYAALKSLQMTEEEIDLFLEECDQVKPEDQETIIQALENLLFLKITEIYQMQLPKVDDRFQPGTIYNGPALFWVAGNAFTRNLIRELKELADPVCWGRSPDSLKQLLSLLPSHDYPPLQTGEQDHGIYVTPVNQQQLRAAQVVRSEPVVVVTGPPGTGKSQLVLNLVTEAFLRGEKVLFASRNNRAVDVVMQRLLYDLKFQGAVRTGSTKNRLIAARQMKVALDSILVTGHGSEETLKATQLRYYETRQNTLQAQEQLEKVRKLAGLQLSYDQERSQYLEFLPKGLSKIAESTVPNYQAAEIESLQSHLASMLELALACKAEKLRLETDLYRVETEGQSDYPVVAELHRLEDQWGTFGDGFIRTQNYQSLELLIEHINDWFNLIRLFEIKAQAIGISQKINQCQKELSEKRGALPEGFNGLDEVIASNHTSPAIDQYIKQSKRLEDRLMKYSAGTISIWERLLNWISRGALLRKDIRALEWLYQQLDLSIDKSLGTDTEHFAVQAIELNMLLTTVALCQELASSKLMFEAISQQIQELEVVLPEAVIGDINKMKSFEFDDSRLKTALHNLLNRANKLTAKAQEMAVRINNKLDGNEDQISILADFKQSQAGKDRLLWQLNLPATPDVIIKHLTKWHNLVSFWSADASSRFIRDSLSSLPTEDEALVHLRETQDELLRLGGEILRATWLARARKVRSETLQKTHDYITAVEQLSGEYNKDTYNSYKVIEKENLSAAVEIFPIWATTNLSAKTNFPLANGFFDMVIIDEASQCDFPSALPLLYRGKRNVIIGDPNQLRHVATLSKDADQELALRSGVAIGAFSYNAHSLYDIAQRSSGIHPGALLLNEHYRSDARIINFSNRVFYNNQLVIKTDLSQRNYRKTFLNQFGGMYWLQVNGQSERPPRDKSLYNQVELDCIQRLLPRLIEKLKEHELENPSIGIVTPYREQGDRIQAWVNEQYGETDWITVGTAHKYQGDEKDFMIFSTVLAPGISEGSLRWLQRTRNLLNVAVTRARVGLIVVGDWNFCQSLKDDHCFKALAEYVAQQPDRLAAEIQDLPIFSKPVQKIVGYVTDPHNPEHNRTTLRRFIASCSEFIWWADPYFNTHIFDLLWDVFQDQQVTIRDIRLLTARELTEPRDNNKPQLSLERHELMRTELMSRGIRMEMRIMNRRDLPHDRLLYSPGQAINMPPFAGAYGDHRHVSEYTRSGTSRDLFLKYWDKANEVFAAEPRATSSMKVPK
jgi:hypothetical protein